MREPNSKLINAAKAKGIGEDQLISLFREVGSMSEAEALIYIAGLASATAALDNAREITNKLGSFKDVDAGAQGGLILFVSKRKKGRRCTDPVGNLVQRKLDAKKVNE